MQPNNTAVWSTIYFLSLSYMLLYLQHNFRTSVNFPLLIHMNWRNTIAYRIVDTADSKNKVKEGCVLLPLQFKLDSHTLHARMEYCKICTARNRSMFWNYMWQTTCSVTHSDVAQNSSLNTCSSVVCPKGGVILMSRWPVNGCDSNYNKCFNLWHIITLQSWLWLC